MKYHVLRKTLVFDVDGVLAEFCYDFTCLAADLRLVQYPWYGSEQANWRFNFNVDKVWREVDQTPDFWYHLPTLCNDADFDAMHEAAKDYNIFYITGRQGDSAAEQTVKWLKGYGFPQGALFLSEPKTDKLPIILPHRHSIVGVLEDKPDIVIKLRAENIPTTARLWKYTEHLASPVATSVKEFIYDVDEGH